LINKRLTSNLAENQLKLLVSLQASWGLRTISLYENSISVRESQ